MSILYKEQLSCCIEYDKNKQCPLETHQYKVFIELQSCGSTREKYDNRIIYRRTT